MTLPPPAEVEKDKTHLTTYLSCTRRTIYELFFTLCLVGLILERMENIGKKSGWKIVFSTVWQRVKNTEDGKLGRKFSLPGHKFHPPKSGGKLWREKCSHSQIIEMPSLSQRSQQLKKEEEEEDNFPTPDSAQFIITTATQK